MKTSAQKIGLIWIILVLLGGAGCSRQSAASAQSSLLEASGMIEARQVSVASDSGGKVLKVAVEEGQQVESGQLLVSLSDAELRAQLDQQQSALQAAQANLDLLNNGPTQAQIEAAQAQLDQAEANLKMANNNLEAAAGKTRPEALDAVRQNLQRARQNYDALKVVFTTQQLQDVLAASNQAQASLSATRVRRESLLKQTGLPGAVLAVSEAAVADAQSAADAARNAYEAAQDSNRSYNDQLQLARLSWEIAQSNLSQAQARLEGLEQETGAATEALEAAKATVNEARDLVESAQTAFDSLSGGIAGKQLQAAWGEVQRAQEQMARFSSAPAGAGSASSLLPLETLMDQVDVAAAARALAAANLAELQAGARPEQIAAAQAGLDQAHAVIQMLGLQIGKTSLSSPLNGWVISRSIQPGEIAMPGAELLRLADLSQVRLTVYIPETQIGQIKLGQQADVSVDAFAGKTFPGQVSFIAQQAEFTPENVQTKEQRVNLVFEVQISLDNPDQLLKPGMPADAVIHVQ